MGMPPIYGIYASIIPLICYAILGTSKYVSIGPAAIPAILIYNSISLLALPFSQDYISWVIVVGLGVGITQLIMAVFKMGFLMQLISTPVLQGFISAAAIIIFLSQVSEFFGIECPKELKSFEKLKYTLTHLKQTNGITLAMSGISFVMIYYIQKYRKSIPVALICIIISGIVTYTFRLDNQNIRIIGEIPSTLPFFKSPSLDLKRISNLLPTIITLSLIGCIGSIGIAKALENQKKDHKININQELIALGVSKIIASFFQAIPTSASYSRTAINTQSGAKTPIATLITVVIIIIALVTLTPMLFFIPKCVLSSMIMVSVLGLIDYKAFINVLSIRRREFFTMLITFIGTLFLGIDKGILIGVLISFVFIQYYSSRPHIAELVNIPNTVYFRNIKRFPHATQDKDYLIIRFDNQLYFANSNFFKEQILEILSTRISNPKSLILHTANMHNIDTTGLQSLRDLQNHLVKQEINLLITASIGPVRDMMQRSGFMDELGKDHFFMNITDAITYCKSDSSLQITQEALQSNTNRSFLD